MQIRIVHLSEGIAGHDGQVLGVIKTLRDAEYDISVKTVIVSWKIYALRGLLRLLSRKLSRYPNIISTRLIKLCYSITPIADVDIVISGGANLAPLNLALIQILKVKHTFKQPKRLESFRLYCYITSTRVSKSSSNLVQK
ncbi:MAG: hypothetical protein CM15mP22_8390 [Gammaproteobacteria bacterium]|nr:MAG: hypothetical protein CM15mP22_8390 [Gammaproteobacteria bacterium]